MPEWLIRQWLRYAAFQIQHGPAEWLVSCPGAVFREWEQRGWAQEIPCEPKGGLLRLRSGLDTVARKVQLTPLGEQIAKERAGVSA